MAYKESKASKCMNLRFIVLLVIVLMSLVCKVLAQEISGTIIAVYADQDSIVIAADGKATIQENGITVSSLPYCKIRKVDTNIYFAGEGILWSDSGFDQLEMAIRALDDTVGIENQFWLFEKRLIEAFRHFLRSRKQLDKNDSLIQTAGAYWCTFVDDKPAVFKILLLSANVAFAPDSIDIERNTFIAINEPNMIHASKLGGTTLSKKIVQTIDPRQVGIVCWLKSIIVGEVALDSTNVGLPMSILSIKRGTANWVEKGNCQK